MDLDPFSIASAFLMHVGSRHVQFDLTQAQKMLLANPIVKLLVLGAMFYISTKSILWSVVLLAVYFVSVNVLLNEKHALNVFSRSWLKEYGFLEDTKTENPIDLYQANLAKLSM